MPRKSIHWRAIKDYPSFPNNRRSTRFPRRRTVTRRVWKEEDSSPGLRVPDTALFTPWDLPNPTDDAPTLVNYHSIHYSDAGGYAPAPIPGLGMGFGQLPGPGENWLQCHPLSPDTDGDSANDGQELSGYDLIWMSIAADGNVTEHYLNGTTSNPLDPHNYWTDSRTNITGYRDLDTDGISDWNETHYAEAYAYIVNWANTKRAEWVVANRSYLAGTSTENPPEFNATEYLSNQFNPFVAESLPPIILWMDVVTHYDYHYEYGFVKIVDAFFTTVTVEVFDPSPFCININVGNGYSFYSTGQMPHGGSWNITIPMALSYPGMWTGGYKVNVTVLDYNGQLAFMEKEMDGKFSGVINFLEGIWNWVCDQFAQAGEWVKGACNFLGEIIKGIILKLISPFGERFQSMLMTWFNSFSSSLQQDILNTPRGTELQVSGATLESFSCIAAAAFLNGLNIVIWIAMAAAKIFTPLGSAILLTTMTLFMGSLSLYFISEADTQRKVNPEYAQYLAETSADDAAIGVIAAGAGFLSAIFTLLGVHGSIKAGNLVGSDKTFLSLCIIIALFSWALGAMSYLAISTISPWDDFILGMVSIILGIISGVMGAISIINQPEMWEIGVLSIIVSISAIILSVISINSIDLSGGK